MRRLLLVFVLAFVGLDAGAAFAQQAVHVNGDNLEVDVEEKPQPWSSLSQRDKEREMQAQEWQGPSGFWTSPHKATHGAYRYRLMGIGGALLLIMGLLVYRLIKKANNDRDRRG
jgi:hypothetical protein